MNTIFGITSSDDDDDLTPTGGWSFQPTLQQVKQYEGQFKLNWSQITGAPAGFAENATPAGGRVVPNVAAYLVNNATFNVRDFGATGGNQAVDTAAFQAAHDAAIAVGGGRVVIPVSDYGIPYAPVGVQVRPGVEWYWQGGRTLTPANAGTQARVFTTDGVEHLGPNDSIGAIIFRNAVMSGNRPNRGPYSLSQMEHSNLINLSGNVAQVGRVRVIVDGGDFSDSPGDAIAVGPNVDLSVTNISGRDCFRGVLTIFGGNSVIRGGDFRFNGTVENYGLHIELDVAGYGGTMAAEIFLDNVQCPDGRCTVSVVPGTPGTVIDISRFSCGPGSVFSGCDAAVHLSNFLIRSGPASSDVSRFVNCRDMLLTAGRLTVTRAGAVGTQTLYAAHIFPNVEYTGPNIIDFRDCKFEVEADVQAGDTTVAVYIEPNYLSEGHQTIVDGCTISKDFDIGIQLAQGGTLIERNTKNYATVPLWASAGTLTEYDITRDNVTVGGNATKWAHLEVATAACVLRHKNCIVDSSLAGISTTYGIASLTTLGERVILAPAAPTGSIGGVVGDRRRLKVPVSGSVYEWVSTTTSDTASVWKPALTLG